jgi:hypothetical protein
LVTPRANVTLPPVGLWPDLENRQSHRAWRFSYYSPIVTQAEAALLLSLSRPAVVHLRLKFASLGKWGLAERMFYAAFVGTASACMYSRHSCATLICLSEQAAVKHDLDDVVARRQRFYRRGLAELGTVRSAAMAKARETVTAQAYVLGLAMRLAMKSVWTTELTLLKCSAMLMLVS